MKINFALLINNKPIGLMLAAIVLTSILLTGCAAVNSFAADSKTKPADFAVEYHWQNGSVAPQYHYQYDIKIKSDGAGEIKMSPGYNPKIASRWTRQFKVEGRQMNQLYQAMRENKLFSNVWQQQSAAPPGSDNQSLSITANARRYWLAGKVIQDQEKSAAAIFGAVQSIVPQTIMDELNVERDEYIKNYPRQ